MLKKLTPLVIILLLAFPLVAQFPKPGSGSGAGGGSGDATSIQGRAVASTAPANLECLLWDAGGSTWEPGACAGSTTGAAMAAADYPVVRTSATVLTLPAIAAGFARVGEVLSAAVASSTFTVTSGTGTLWIALASDLTVVVRHNIVGTCSATCTAVGSATGFEPGDLPLYQWDVTSDALAATGTLKLTPYGSRPLVAGTNVSFGHTAGVTTISATVLASKIWLPAAGCQNATVSLFWDTPTSNPAVAACITGTNTQKGVADFADSASLSMQQTLILPTDFTGAIDVRFKWLTAATSGDVVWQAAAICVADAETDDPAFNTASTVTDTAKGTTLQTNDAAITGMTITGCAAGELFHFKVLRDAAHASDSLAATARLIGVELTLQRN